MTTEKSPLPPEEKPQEKTEQPEPKEYGGRKKGLNPTRYDDWEKDGRAIDF